MSTVIVGAKAKFIKDGKTIGFATHVLKSEGVITIDTSYIRLVKGYTKKDLYQSTIELLTPELEAFERLDLSKTEATTIPSISLMSGLPILTLRFEPKV